MLLDQGASPGVLQQRGQQTQLWKMHADGEVGPRLHGGSCNGAGIQGVLFALNHLFTGKKDQCTEWMPM